jgi:hypothetical protein
MKVFQPGTRGKRTVFAQPGNKHPVSHFLDEHGKPRMFQVAFVEGEATVDDQLGQYLIDEGIAKTSPIILLDEVAA